MVLNALFIFITTKVKLHRDRIDFLLKIAEPIPQFTNVTGLFIFKFKDSRTLLEHIYRELRAPPVQYTVCIRLQLLGQHGMEVSNRKKYKPQNKFWLIDHVMYSYVFFLKAGHMSPVSTY